MGRRIGPAPEGHRSTDFGPTLRKLRETVGISQNRLADICEIDPSTVNRLEQGERNPTYDTILTLAYHLDLDRPAVRELFYAAGFIYQEDTLSAAHTRILGALSHTLDALPPLQRLYLEHSIIALCNGFRVANAKRPSEPRETRETKAS
jgi:transcriptional regulator with XRE-family HTH domain